MSVFLPRENIFFIDEWLRYHIVVGFTHFYLYNNMGSRYLDCGNSIEVTGRNKRGERIYPLLSGKSDGEVQRDLEHVLAPFVARGYVTQVAWQPRDEHGDVTYAQAGAFLDFVERYAEASDWVSFTDLDEFVVPVRHGELSVLVGELERAGVTYVTLPQKCFASRFGGDGRPVPEVLKIVECAPLTVAFGVKAMIKASTLRTAPEASYDIHAPAADPVASRHLIDGDLLRFNHYKYNAWEVNWVRRWIDPGFRLDAIDAAMMRRFSDRTRALTL